MDKKNKEVKFPKDVEKFLIDNPEMQDKILMDNNGKFYIYLPIDVAIKFYQKK